MGIKMTFEGDIRPCERNIYFLDEKIKPKTMMNPLSADFRQKIKNAFLIQCHKEKRLPLFPLPEKEIIKINIDIYYTKTCNIISQLKNILDSLNGIAYKDDKQIKDIKIMRHKSKKHRIEIEIFTLDELKNAFNKSIQLTVSNIEPLSNLFHGIRSFLYTEEKNDNNKKNIAIIREQISKDFPSNPFNSDIEIQMNFYFKSRKRIPDIDNIAIIFLFTMYPKIFIDLKCIKKLALNISCNDKITKDKALINICSATSIVK